MTNMEKRSTAVLTATILAAALAVPALATEATSKSIRVLSYKGNTLEVGEQSGTDYKDRRPARSQSGSYSRQRTRWVPPDGFQLLRRLIQRRNGVKEADRIGMVKDGCRLPCHAEAGAQRRQQGCAGSVSSAE